MANIKVRAASLYVKGSKVAEIEGTDYDLQGGDEEQFGGEGFLGYSEGTILSKINATGVVPVNGMKVDLMGMFLRKEDVSVALSLVNGKIHKIDMRILNVNIKSSHRNGTQTGSFSFGGGQPVVTG